VGVILIQEVLSVNTKDLDKTSAASEELVQVFSNLVNVEVGALVDSSEVDDLFLPSLSIFVTSFVKQVEANKTITHDIEHIFIFRVDWESILDKFIIFALVVDASSKGTDFLIQVG
jgi:hypothetical protein